MKISLGLSIMALVFASSVDAACVAQSPATQQKLVELYTSEGCSSCPPADQWLSTVKSETAIALAFHVDYWDSLGWRDRFADPRFSARQRDVLGAHGYRTVYTPEVALNGKEWQQWSGGIGTASTAASATLPAHLKLQIEAGNPLQLSLQTQGDAVHADKSWRAFFAVTEDGLHSAVRAGENSGRTLQHDHVVRAFAGPFALDQATTTLSFPADTNTAHANVVAFVQNTETGVIAQVVQQSLHTCAVN